jgi:diguanylate cyclase (GGDEF)-like protein
LNSIAAGSYPVSLPDLLSDLNELESQIVEQPTMDSPLADWVVKRLESDYPEPRSLTPQQRLPIDLTDSIFKHALSDKRLLPRVQASLQKLKVPLLKMMLKDPSLIDDRKHPTRQLVNQLVRLSCSRGPGSGGLPKGIDDAVAQIAQHEASDCGEIEEVLERINHLVAMQNNAFLRNMKRVQVAREGQEKLHQARLRVASELAVLTQGRAVPAVFKHLLESGWRKLLVLTLLKQGENSEAWKTYTAALGQLLELLQVRSKDARLVVTKDYLSKVKAVAQVLKRGIDEGGAGTFNDYRGADELGRLLLHKGNDDKFQSLLKPELLQAEVAQAESLEPELLEPESPAPESFEPELLQAELLQSEHSEPELPASSKLPTIGSCENVAARRSIWSRKVQRMEIGDGLILEPDSDTEHRLILAWQAGDCSSLVFVDEHGHESSKFYLEEIVARLMARRVAIVPRDEMPPFDQGVLTMIQKVYDDIATDAARDEVTGLYNRKKFTLLLEEAIRAARRDGCNHVVCQLNLDKFKMVNASLGLAVGDELLRTVAERLNSFIDQDTMVARLGADQFALLMRNRSLSSASAQIHALRKALSQSTFRRDDESFNLSASWGLVNVDEGCIDANTLLKTAYQACDVAKDGGRDQFYVYTESDSAIKHKNSVMDWTKRIGGLLEKNDLRLRLQKIAPLHPGNKHQHNEVLLSIVIDGESRPVPAEMIQAAEAYGLMQSVDRWVVKTALGWMQENPGLLDKMGGFAINLSGTSLNDEQFLEFVLEEIGSSGVKTSMLCFEVTETSTIENLDYTSSFIEEVKQLGCSFALDDFGTGMSSYAYLKTLPVDYLKIDGVFIRDIANSPTDYAMVKSINEIGHFLGMKTIAEFVENEAIAHVLSEIGVDYAQGYGIQKPYYLDEIGSHLAQQERTQKMLRSG